MLFVDIKSKQRADKKNLPTAARMSSFRVFNRVSRSLSGRLKKYRHIWPFYEVEAYFKNRESSRLYARARRDMVPHQLEQRIIDDLTREGISLVQLSELLPAELFEQTQEWAERQLEDEAVKRRIERVRAGERTVGKFYQILPFGERPTFGTGDAVMRIALSDPILRIVSSYFGMVPRLNAANLLYNIPVAGPPVYSQRWHRDPEDRQLLKIFLYLRDVDDDAGPFCYISGSHNGGAYGHLYRQRLFGANYPGDSVVEARFSAKARRAYPEKAGTLIFSDTTGFHRGGQATEKPRLLFNAIYTSNASPVNLHDRFRLSRQPQQALGPVAQYAIDRVRAP